MQFTTVLLAAVATVLPTAMAGNAIVKNNCAFTVYVQSWTNNGGSIGAVQTLPAKSGVYSEAFKSAGAAIKMGTYSALSAPLTLEYTPSKGSVYYDLSNNAGNPFSTYRNDLFPSVTSCPSFDCAASTPSCYSSGSSIKVKACEDATDLTVTLCAAS